jgi:hypothetical protein
VKTLPKGTILFHGSAEPEIRDISNSSELRHGGDNVFWTAFQSLMAQCYIPESGSSIYCHLRSFYKPDCNALLSPITTFQQEAGLFFDEVEWRGSQPVSYRVRRTPEFDSELAAILGHSPDQEPDYQKIEKATLRVFFNRLTAIGYEFENHEFSLEYAQAKLKTHFNVDTAGKTQWTIKPAAWRLEGRLLVLKTTREINLCDIASGNDGCLLEPDHLKYSLFQKAATTRDAILINDFAQIGTDHENFGHEALGILGNPGDLLELIANIPAYHPANFWENHYRPRNYDSPEFSAWQKETPKAA